MSQPSRLLFEIELTPPNRATATQPPSPALEAVRVALPLGLGDWVYGWAHPIGCWLDRWTAGWRWGRTKFCGCSACSGRRARWNSWLPDVRSWAGGWELACSGAAKGLLRSFLALVDHLF